MAVGAEVILVEVEGINLEGHFLAAVGAGVFHQSIVVFFVLVLIVKIFILVVAEHHVFQVAQIIVDGFHVGAQVVMVFPEGIDFGGNVGQRFQNFLDQFAFAFFRVQLQAFRQTLQIGYPIAQIAHGNLLQCFNAACWDNHFDLRFIYGFLGKGSGGNLSFSHTALDAWRVFSHSPTNLQRGQAKRRPCDALSKRGFPQKIFVISHYARDRYSPVRVSILITSPMLMNRGTWIS